MPIIKFAGTDAHQYWCPIATLGSALGTHNRDQYATPNNPAGTPGQCRCIGKACAKWAPDDLREPDGMGQCAL